MARIRILLIPGDLSTDTKQITTNLATPARFGGEGVRRLGGKEVRR
jgi:hypothetical protein